MSHTPINFLVEGRPAPQGSKNAYVRGGRAVMVEASKFLPAWRLAVTGAARQSLMASESLTPFSVPVRLVVRFFIERPKTTKYEHYPAGKPDLDHYVRAVGDALTQAGVLSDDSLICEIVAKKLWASSDPASNPVPGAAVYVEAL